ncbi:MAG: hypothetical protein J0I09_14895 [Sphingobacteriia bacterium]|nr:hypothetical protein [Sphingobacteriia bacterium]
MARGRIIEENHYYAYGLKIAAISSNKIGDALEGSLKNNYQYNDKELWDDGDLNWLDYGFRNYDPQIGRFVQIDPLTDETPNLSSYHYAFLDLINNIDAFGLVGKPVITNFKNAFNYYKMGEVTVSEVTIKSVRHVIKKVGPIANKLIGKEVKHALVMLSLKIVSAGNEGAPNGYAPNDLGTEYNSNGADKGQIDQEKNIKAAINKKGKVDPEIDFGIVVDRKGNPVIRTDANGKRHYISRLAATYKDAKKYDVTKYCDNPNQDAYPDGESIGYVAKNAQLDKAGVKKGDIGYVVSDDGAITYFIVADYGEHGKDNIEVSVFLAQRVGAGPKKGKNGKWAGLTRTPTLKFYFLLGSNAGQSLINPTARTQDGLNQLGEAMRGPKANP